MKELLEKILGQIKKTPSGVRAYEDLYHICLETQKTDIPLSVEYLKKLSDIIENRIPQSETDKELRFLFMLHKKVLLAAAPFDFESYLLYVEWEREPDKKFYVPRREVMHPVVQAMQDLIDDRLDLLTISMPPGTGKSTLGIFFLSWVMGRFPDSQSLASAHSGMLTRSFYDGVYQIITDSEYLWADVFPGVKMAATNSKEETIDLHKKSKLLWLGDKNKTLAYAPKSDEMVLTVHRWFANKSCPGDWLYNRLGNLAAEVTKRLTGGSTDTGKVDVPSDGKTLYRVQTGAFSKRSNADAWAAKLKAAGFDTYIVQMGNLYKVQVGAYSQKSNAENMMVKLKAAGYDAFITTKSGTAAGTTKKSAAEIAKEIYNGTCSDARWSSWGNGADRVNRLKQAGYDPSEV